MLEVVIFCYGFPYEVASPKKSALIMITGLLGNPNNPNNPESPYNPKPLPLAEVAANL